MSKKQPARPKVEITGFDQETSLPTPETASALVNQVTPATGKKTFSPQDATPPADRVPGLTAKGRIKFTTMLKPELRQTLENIAQNKQISVADVLEIMITEYLK